MMMLPTMQIFTCDHTEDEKKIKWLLFRSFLLRVEVVPDDGQWRVFVLVD
jgi:hypothetical protein